MSVIIDTKNKMYLKELFYHLAEISVNNIDYCTRLENENRALKAMIEQLKKPGRESNPKTSPARPKESNPLSTPN